MNINDLVVASITVVKHYPYRTGIVMDKDKIMPQQKYTHGDAVDRLHSHLAEQMGLHHTDNHEAFDIAIRGKRYSLYFSDWYCTVGTKVTER